MYCINCGVKLADTEAKCPLCGVRVYHPDLGIPSADPLYPKHRYPAPEAESRAALIVITTVMAIALLTSLYIDYQINKTVSWSGFSTGGILVAYVLLVLPGWFPKPNPVIFVPCGFAAILLYLMYI